MKIVLSGATRSGKTTFLKNMDSKALCVDEPINLEGEKTNTTVALDVGVITINDVPITLFGTPGLNRFGMLRTILLRGTDALIFFFDGQSNKFDNDANAILKEISLEISKKNYNFPIIFAVNKSDLEIHRNSEKISKIINQTLQNSKLDNLKPLIHPRIFEISGKTGLMCKELLQFALSLIEKKWKKVIVMLNENKNDIDALQNSLKISKDSLRDLLNDLEIRKLIVLDRNNLTWQLTPIANKFLKL